MRRKAIGDQELALLQYLGENEPASVGEVAAGFGEARGASPFHRADDDGSACAPRATCNASRTTACTATAAPPGGRRW